MAVKPLRPPKSGNSQVAVAKPLRLQKSGDKWRSHGEAGRSSAATATTMGKQREAAAPIIAAAANQGEAGTLRSHVVGAGSREPCQLALEASVGVGACCMERTLGAAFKGYTDL
ncbi:hypothetical protein TURU_010584 [Turdus rufiventris]|nr:hypothetical protein TURU_010584 [Turdus rufiventris]